MTEKRVIRNTYISQKIPEVPLEKILYPERNHFLSPLIFVMVSFDLIANDRAFCILGTIGPRDLPEKLGNLREDFQKLPNVLKYINSQTLGSIKTMDSPPCPLCHQTSLETTYSVNYDKSL